MEQYKYNGRLLSYKNGLYTEINSQGLKNAYLDNDGMFFYEGNWYECDRYNRCYYQADRELVRQQISSNKHERAFVAIKELFGIDGKEQQGVLKLVPPKWRLWRDAAAVGLEVEQVSRDIEKLLPIPVRKAVSRRDIISELA